MLSRPFKSCLFLVAASAVAVLVAGTSEPEALLTVSHRSFADKLTAELYTLDANQCSSSWGVSMALSLVYPGADESTARQLRDVLGYPDSINQRLVWSDAASRLVAENSGRCQWSAEDYDDESCGDELPNLEIANSVWIDDGDQLVPAYEAIVEDFVEQIDFAGQEAGETVNSWAEEKTNGLIDSIIQEGPIRSDVFLLAINSIYLKASWANPFPEYSTNKDAFYSGPLLGEASAQKEAYFMHMVDYFDYSHDAVPGYQILQLPFNGYSLSMIFVLSAAGAQSTEIVESAQVVQAMPDLKRTRVAVGLPKFKFESLYAADLKQALISTGLDLPFRGGLDSLVQGRAGFISDIIQKTVIDVHEKGVEAAAVTMVMVATSALTNEPDPTLFLADRAFQFFIYDKTEDIVLFEGRVVDPGVDGTMPNAPLKGKHADGDFWKSHFGVPDVLPPTQSVANNDSKYDSSSTKNTAAHFPSLMAVVLAGSLVMTYM